MKFITGRTGKGDPSVDRSRGLTKIEIEQVIENVVLVGLIHQHGASADSGLGLSSLKRNISVQPLLTKTAQAINSTAEQRHAPSGSVSILRATSWHSTKLCSEKISKGYLIRPAEIENAYLVGLLKNQEPAPPIRSEASMGSKLLWDGHLEPMANALFSDFDYGTYR